MTTRLASEVRDERYELPDGLLLCPDFPPLLGGVSNYLISVYGRVDLRRIALIAPDIPGAKEFDSGQEYSPHRLTARSAVPGIRGMMYVTGTYHAAKEYLEDNPRRVMHCGHVTAAMAARRLKRRFGTPYLVWTYALEIMDRLLTVPIRCALRDADLVLTISDYTQRYIESLGVPPSRIVKIRPGTDPDMFTPGTDAKAMALSLGLDGKRVLLTVGRIARQQRYKGQDMVIKALPRVIRHVPDIVYVVAGAGDDGNYLEDLAEKIGVADYVKVIGKVDHADLPSLYGCCDAFIMCSREERGLRTLMGEGFGIVFLEANASGKPVIGGNSGGIPDAVRDGHTGVLVDPLDPGSIADAVIRLMRDPALACRLGENGRSWVESEMNWNRAAGEFRDAYWRFFGSPQHGMP